MNKLKMYGLTLSTAALLGLAGAGLTAHAEVTSQDNAWTLGAEKLSSETDGQAMSYADIAEMCMPSMVAITNTSVKNVQDYFDGYYGNFDIFGGMFGGGWNNPFGNYYGNQGSYEEVSAGSGEIVAENDTSYLIATNAHVVSGATELSATFIDETTAPAEIVGSDTTNDLAIIRVMKSDMEQSTIDAVKVIKIGSSDELRVGEEVLAIGNALGYGQSVSKGIVSAKDRFIRTRDEYTGEIEEQDGILQTDASINPGNSGGALLNMKGELIGINSAKYSDTAVEGVGYAISIDKAQPILTDLANGKNPDDAEESSGSEGGVKLGIRCKTLSQAEADRHNAPLGVQVVWVDDNSAAQEAGILAGDIITEFNGETVETTEDLIALLGELSSGDTAEVTVMRESRDVFGGESTFQEGTLTVTFGSTDDAEQKQAA